MSILNQSNQMAEHRSVVKANENTNAGPATFASKSFGHETLEAKFHEGEPIIPAERLLHE